MVQSVLLSLLSILQDIDGSCYELLIFVLLFCKLREFEVETSVGKVWKLWIKIL